MECYSVFCWKAASIHGERQRERGRDRESKTNQIPLPGCGRLGLSARCYYRKPVSSRAKREKTTGGDLG